MEKTNITSPASATVTRSTSPRTIGNVIDFNEIKARRLFAEAYSCHIGGMIEEAITMYEMSLKLFPTSEAYTFLGWAHSARKEYETAIDYCKKAVALDPDYGNPYNDIGAYLIELGREDEAVEWLKKAILAKNYDCRFYSYFNLGKVYEDKNLIVKAITCFEYAVKINPDFSAATKELEKLKSRLN